MQLSRRTFAAGVAAIAAAPTVTALAQSTPGATPVTSDVEARLLTVMDELGIPGAAIGIVTPESVEPRYLELGVANLETSQPIAADMHFRIASVTKTFVATVILQLVDEQQLSLEDTIADILTDLRVPNTDIVTIRNLLSMRSGLPQLSDSTEYVKTILTEPEEVSFSDYAPFMEDMPVHADPDKEFEYNNFNYNILGEVIEAVTGDSWNQNVQSRITDVLGLPNTLMTNALDIPSPFATGYGYLDQFLLQEQTEEPLLATPEQDLATPVASPDTVSTPVAGSEAYDLTAFNPGVAGAAGGLISTVQDQLVWAQAFGAGELISPEMYAEQTDVYPIDASSPGGYGLGLIDLGGIVGHNGAITGYQAAIVSSPQLGYHIAVLTNAHPVIGLADGAFALVAELLP